MPRPHTSRHAGRLVTALAGSLGLLVAAACGRAPARTADAPLETVDVTAKPDAAATLDADRVEAPRADAAGFAGVLPPDFPRDVPLPEPSSLVDFGPKGITVEVQSPVARAKADYSARLRARGFAPAGDGSWTKGSRRLALAFADASGATRITIDVR